MSSLEPIAVFIVILISLLFIPHAFERIKLPAVLGILVTGLLLGPKALGVVTDDLDILHFLSDVGKLMIMFFAGMEIDLKNFIKRWKESLLLGSLTFLLPLIGGFAVAKFFDFSNLSALVIGSFLASHTLVSLPVLKKHNILNRRVVAVTVGATIITDIGSLMILALVISLHTVGIDGPELALRLIGMFLYFPITLSLTHYVTKTLLPKFENEKKEEHDRSFTLLIICMLFAAFLAKIIHLEGIVGAFVAGLAIGDVVRGTELHSRIETVGNTLFVPMFFLTTGALIDPYSFARMDFSDYMFTIAIVLGLLFTKYIAAKLAGKILKFDSNDSNISWSLSIPQVAATLAAALVAFDCVNANGIRLIDEQVLDTILVLMAVTVVAGPILTNYFAGKKNPNLTN